MIFNICGGGGTALNFCVLGGTAAPTNPAENTIWVNTENEITSWAFSAAEPEAPEEGMVWFKVGIRSTVSFNALKKNNITVYPSMARQYIGGAWVDKTAQIYQGGEWKDWGYGNVYYYGNEYDGFTGGITVDQSDHGTAEKMTDHIAFSSTDVGDDDWAHAVCYSASPIDLTGFNTLKAIVNTSPRGNTNGIVKVGAVADIGDFIPTTYHYTNFPGAASAETGDITVTYDISGLSGSYYVGFWNYVGTAKLYALILE